MIVFTLRSLEFIRGGMWSPIYSDLPLVNGRIINLNINIPAGAETHTYDIVDHVGKAKIIANYADDIATVDAISEQVTAGIDSIADSYIYSVQDARRDAMSGKMQQIPVKAAGARRAIDEALEELIGFGNQNTVKQPFYGLYNAPQVPITIVANTGTGSTTEWINKTDQQVLDDLNKAIDDMNDVSKGNERPTDLLLPYTQFQRLIRPVLDRETKTLIELFRETVSAGGLGLNIISVPQLKGAFTGGADGFVLMNRAREKVEGILPVRLEIMPIQRVNMTFKFILEARCGGVTVFYPKSMSYNYGI